MDYADICKIFLYILMYFEKYSLWVWLKLFWQVSYVTILSITSR
jgi:hypothetical protein